MTTLPRLFLLLSLSAVALPAAAEAEIRGITPLGQHLVLPGVGVHTIARSRGPGVFVAASVTGMGVDAAQVAAYVEIDGATVWIGPLGSAAARVGAQVNAGVGVVHSPELGGVAKASFGLAQPLRFERELRVYVRVEAGAPGSVFGSVLVGAAAP
jgi:hypothetical protein